MSNVFGCELRVVRSLVDGFRTRVFPRIAVVRNWPDERVAGGERGGASGENERKNDPVGDLGRTALQRPRSDCKDLDRSNSGPSRFAAAVNPAWGLGLRRAEVTLRCCSDDLPQHEAGKRCWLGGSEGVGARGRGPPSCTEIEMRFRASDWRSCDMTDKPRRKPGPYGPGATVYPLELLGSPAVPPPNQTSSGFGLLHGTTTSSEDVDICSRVSFHENPTDATDGPQALTVTMAAAFAVAGAPRTPGALVAAFRGLKASVRGRCCSSC